MAELSVTRYDAGEIRTRTTPGDFILTHRNDAYSKVIRWGQRIRFRGEDRPYAHWSHAALIVGYRGEIVEALAHGILLNNLSRYKHIEYHYIDSMMSHVDREQATAYAYASLGQGYAWLTILSLAFQILTPEPLTWTPQGRNICSGHVTRGLERGWFVPPKVPQSMLPADLSKAFDIRP